MGPAISLQKKVVLPNEGTRMSKKTALAAALVFLVTGLSNPLLAQEETSLADKKIIGFAPDRVNQIYLREHIAEIEELPLDGLLITVLPDGWDIGPVSPEIGARLQTEQSSGARIWEFSLPAPDGQSYQVTFAYDAPPDYAIAWGTFELSGAYETSEGGTYDISFSGAWDAYVEYEITLSKFTYLLAGSLNSQKTGQSVYEVVNGEFLARGFLEP